MTIGGWLIFAILAGLVALIGLIGALLYYYDTGKKNGSILIVVVTVSIIIALLSGMKWFYSNTASGIRAMTDQKSELANGLEHTVTIYTADGKTIAQYQGKIDIEENAGGYVLFDFEGKRYAYYNCFVESIADIR